MSKILSGAQQARNRMIERQTENTKNYVTPEKAYEVLTNEPEVCGRGSRTDDSANGKEGVG